MKRAKGEVAVELGDLDRADQWLREAESAFRANDDWPQIGAVQRIRGDLAGRIRAVPAATLGYPPDAGRKALEPAGPAAGGTLPSLSDEEREAFAALLSARVIDGVVEQIQGAISPLPPPVTFRGAISASLSAASAIGGREPPRWWVSVGQRCELTVVLQLGKQALEAEHVLSGRPEAAVWRPVVVATGVNREEVELDLIIDAPFVELTRSNLNARCRVEHDEVRHQTGLTVDKPGTYDLRISLLSAGRLVQSLPIHLVAEVGAAV